MCKDLTDYVPHIQSVEIIYCHPHETWMGVQKAPMDTPMEKPCFYYQWHIVINKYYNSMAIEQNRC